MQVAQHGHLAFVNALDTQCIALGQRSLTNELAFHNILVGHRNVSVHVGYHQITPINANDVARFAQHVLFYTSRSHIVNVVHVLYARNGGLGVLHHR